MKDENILVVAVFMSFPQNTLETAWVLVKATEDRLTAGAKRTCGWKELSTAVRLYAVQKATAAE